MRIVPAAPLCVRDHGVSRGSHAHGHFQVLVGLQGVLELEVEGRGRPIDGASLAVWLHAHRHQPLTVADPARQVHLSPSQFAKRCRRAMRLSPMQWLRGQCLEGMDVAEAARRTAHHSPSALTGAMRRCGEQPERPDLLLNS